MTIFVRLHNMIQNFTPEQDQYLQLRQSAAYYVGLREGVSMFAHWKNGVQYVGTTGKTLKQALAEIQEQEDNTNAKFDQLLRI
jgi:hypothetical protein